MSTIKVTNIDPPSAGGAVNVNGVAMPNAGPLSNRNLIINGAMQVWQRGTSATGVSTNGYNSADRFRNVKGTAGTWTLSQSTDVPTGQGFTSSLKYDCTTANASLSAGSFMLLEQRFEGQDLQHLKKGTANAESLTLTFWVRSTKTGTYIAELSDVDNGRTISQSYTVSSTWEKKTLTFAGDTTGALDNDNDHSFQVGFWLAAGSNFTSGTLATSWAAIANANRAVGQVNLADSTSNEFYITGVQLEVGSVATPFEHRSYGDELARCQRYFAQGRGYARGTAAGSRVGGGVYMPVSMRAIPTAFDIATIAGFGNTPTAGNAVHDFFAFTGIPNANGEVLLTYSVSAEL